MNEERLMNKNGRKYGAAVICLLVILLLSACAASVGSSVGASDSNGNEAGDTVVSQATSEQAEEPSVQFVKENDSLYESSQEAETYEQSAENPVEETSMTMMIDDTSVQVEWEDNESVRALKGLVQDEPLTIQMSTYGGFEQVGSIGTVLPRNDGQTTTSAGDIVLYSGDQIVIFYGSSSWAYTRLGKITDQTEEDMAQLLGNGDVTITLKTD